MELAPFARADFLKRRHKLSMSRSCRPSAKEATLNPEPSFQVTGPASGSRHYGCSQSLLPGHPSHATLNPKTLNPTCYITPRPEARNRVL